MTEKCMHSRSRSNQILKNPSWQNTAWEIDFFQRLVLKNHLERWVTTEGHIFHLGLKQKTSVGPKEKLHAACKEAHSAPWGAQISREHPRPGRQPRVPQCIRATCSSATQGRGKGSRAVHAEAACTLTGQGPATGGAVSSECGAQGLAVLGCSEKAEVWEDADVQSECTDARVGHPREKPHHQAWGMLGQMHLILCTGTQETLQRHRPHIAVQSDPKLPSAQQPFYPDALGQRGTVLCSHTARACAAGLGCPVNPHSNGHHVPWQASSPYQQNQQRVR